MAKRSRRRPPRYERDHAGCIWGFIHIFDFRHGRSARKLLADRRRGNGQSNGPAKAVAKVTIPGSAPGHQNIKDGEEIEIIVADSIKTSVKELMEEEMFNEKGPVEKSGSEDLELLDKECHSHVRMNRKRANKSFNNLSDAHLHDLYAAEHVVPQESSHLALEQKGLDDLDLNIVMEDLRQIFNRSTNCIKHDDGTQIELDQAYSIDEEKLTAAVKLFISQRLDMSKRFGDVKASTSEEFMDALQKLGSNKDLFLKLLQNPKSQLVKPVDDLEDVQLSKDQKCNSAAISNILEDKNTISKPDEISGGRHLNFFRRRSKSMESFPSVVNEKSQSSSKIVILKPGPAGLRCSDAEFNVSSQNAMETKIQGERNTSHFSFNQIKRRLKHAMGKERQGISPNEMLQRSECQDRNDIEKGVSEENIGWRSPNRHHFFTERFTKPSIASKRGDKTGNPKDVEAAVTSETSGNPKLGVSSIYIEAKKHLSEMLKNGDENDELISSQLPKSLGKILSLPEYCSSPHRSPRKGHEDGFVTAQMRFSPRGTTRMVNEDMTHVEKENSDIHPDPAIQNLETRLCNIDDISDKKVESPEMNTGTNALNISEKKLGIPDSSPSAMDMDSGILEENSQSLTDDGIVPEGVEDTQGTTGTRDNEDAENSNAFCESSSSPVQKPVNNSSIAVIDNEGKTSQCLNSDVADLKISSPAMPSPPHFLECKEVEDPDGLIDRSERPSPISVLEPLFAEDEISPASTITRPVQLEIQPRQIQFEEQRSYATDQDIRISCTENEESAFEYVEAVLLGSGLNWDEFLLRWLSSSQILDPSLFDEVELFSTRSFHDQRLLFDCANEVLEEICHSYFGCFPRMSSFKQTARPVPKAMDLIHEVWEGVEWHLLQHSQPQTLDHLVRKDMEKSRRWMNLQFELGNIGLEMEEAILEELVEETVFSFLTDALVSEFVVFTPELDQFES